MRVGGRGPTAPPAAGSCASIDGAKRDRAGTEPGTIFEVTRRGWRHRQSGEPGSVANDVDVTNPSTLLKTESDPKADLNFKMSATSG